MYYLSTEIQNALSSNLKDWCRGGPHPNGWTRSGLPIRYRPLKVIDYRFEELAVDELLAKNRIETQRWHIGFLETYVALGKAKFYWKRSGYYHEYLAPRYDDDTGYAHASRFLSLFEDILDCGVRKAVWAADVRDLKMPFDYFRFDGCHRICCAKVAGFDLVPALVFTVEPSC